MKLALLLWIVISEVPLFASWYWRRQVYFGGAIVSVDRAADTVTVKYDMIDWGFLVALPLFLTVLIYNVIRIAIGQDK
jgi:hypothetical protein